MDFGKAGDEKASERKGDDDLAGICVAERRAVGGADIPELLGVLQFYLLDAHDVEAADGNHRRASRFARCDSIFSVRCPDADERMAFGQDNGATVAHFDSDADCGGGIVRVDERIPFSVDGDWPVDDGDGGKCISFRVLVAADRDFESVDCGSFGWIDQLSRKYCGICESVYVWVSVPRDGDIFLRFGFAGRSGVNDGVGHFFGAEE